jgi:putative sporulation protein YtaF
MENMHLLSIFLLAVSTSLDNFGVGIAYGIRRVCIPFASNLLIAVMNCAGTMIAMIAGERLFFFMEPKTASFIGSALFLAAGSLVLTRTIARKLRGQEVVNGAGAGTADISGKPAIARAMMIINRPDIITLHCEDHVRLKEGFLLAMALTFSNLVTGVGAGLIGLNLAFTTLFIFVFSILAVSAGLRLGGYTGRHWFGGLSDPVAGLLLIAIGIYELAF